MAATHPPDMVLIDLGSDAERAGARLDMLDALDCPVMTLMSDVSLAREAISSGARAVLARDVDAATLITALHAVIHGLVAVDARFEDLLVEREPTPALDNAPEARDLPEALTPHKHE